jgi:circadian clock protein KaiC
VPRSTGVPRLDELLEGGLPSGSATLLQGQPFLGKDVLSRLYVLAGLHKGIPAILALTTATPAEARAALTVLDARFPHYERSGLVRYVDLHSAHVGLAPEPRHTLTLAGPHKVRDLQQALAELARKRAGRKGGPSIVVDSLSTLVAYAGVSETFRALHIGLAQARAWGATSLLLLDRGMHAEDEVQALLHLVQGSLELRNMNGKMLLHMEGHKVAEDRGWVEYRFSDQGFDLTGSFAAGRIR